MFHGRAPLSGIVAQEKIAFAADGVLALPREAFCDSCATSLRNFQLAGGFGLARDTLPGRLLRARRLSPVAGSVAVRHVSTVRARPRSRSRVRAAAFSAASLRRGRTGVRWHATRGGLWRGGVRQSQFHAAGWRTLARRVCDDDLDPAGLQQYRHAFAVADVLQRLSGGCGGRFKSNVQRKICWQGLSCWLREARYERLRC